MSRRENLSSGFPTRSYTNQAVQPQKMVRSLKFWIKKVEEMHYLCYENKDADQLRSYFAADLPFFSHIHVQSTGFLMMQLQLTLPPSLWHCVNRSMHYS